MPPLRPFAAAIGAAMVVILLLRLFGDSMPGEGFGALGTLLLLLIGGLGFLPPLAFGLAGRGLGIRRLPLVVLLMAVAQFVLIWLYIGGLLNFAPPLPDAVGLALMFIAATILMPTLAALAALAVTGNLGK